MGTVVPPVAIAMGCFAHSALLPTGRVPRPLPRWYRFPVAAPAKLRPRTETVVAPAAFAMGCVAQRVLLRRSADKWRGRWGLFPDTCSVPGFGIGTAFAAL